MSTASQQCGRKRKHEDSQSPDPDDGQDVSVTIKLSDFTNNNEFSDLVIHCGARTWHAHRIILASQSRYFRAACSGRFMDEFKIDLQEDDPDIVNCMLGWFYKHDYRNPTDQSQDFLQHSALVYAIADKYEVLGLKTCVLQNVSAYLRGKKFHSDDFIECIPRVWTSTLPSDKGLRNIFLECFFVNRADFFEDPGIMSRLKTVEEFASDVLLEDWKLSSGLGSDLRLSVQRSCMECGRRVRSSRCRCGGTYIVNTYDYI